MTVMFHDIHMRLDYTLAGRSFEGVNVWELLYADETMLIRKRARELNLLIQAIIIESGKYNMKLNYKKIHLL